RQVLGDKFGEIASGEIHRTADAEGLDEANRLTAPELRIFRVRLLLSFFPSAVLLLSVRSLCLPVTLPRFIRARPPAGSGHDDEHQNDEQHEETASIWPCSLQS